VSPGPWYAHVLTAEGDPIRVDYYAASPAPADSSVDDKTADPVGRAKRKSSSAEDRVKRMS
jgi:hypothetical protein